MRAPLNVPGICWTPVIVPQPLGKTRHEFAAQPPLVVLMLRPLLAVGGLAPLG